MAIKHLGDSRRELNHWDSPGVVKSLETVKQPQENI